VIRTGQFRYVRYQDIQAREQAGWMVVADLGPVHGEYSVLMWCCDCGGAE